MSSSTTCRECGTAIPGDSPRGFCAKCLFGLGLAAADESFNDQKSETRSEETEAAPLSEKAGDPIGRYRLLQEIGHGGCGVVYMAEQAEPIHRKVALKVIKLGMDTRQVVARFEAERQALALMDHPNIAKVLDAGATETGRPYFVMELVGGIKITDYCDQNNLSTRQRLDMFIQVCRAVQHAHQKGIIHRDIKPSNVLVATQDGVPTPKVIDFGIAKATQGRLTNQTLFTAFEQFLGTPAYMSPEQAQLGGLDVDTRSDIYSLGVLLYELLTGKTPFDTKELVAAGLDEMRRTIREVEPVKPSTRLTQEHLRAQRKESSASAANASRSTPGSQLSTDLDWIVMKCLEKDRARRYETANGLASDLQRHLNNEPVVARPPSKLYEFKKTVRRHKFGFAATAAIVLVLVVGVTMSTWQAVRATRAEHGQNRLRQRAQDAQASESRERVKAQTEATKSQQIAQFLKDMLKGVSPSKALGRDTKMLKEILDTAADRVGKELANHPEVEADLRVTLGNVYLDLGDYTNAEAMHQKALELRQGFYGEEHTSVAESLGNLADALSAQGRLAAAEAKGREALAMWRKLLPSRDARVARAQSDLSMTLTFERKYREAESLQREALATQRRLLGDTNLAVAESLVRLALVLDQRADVPVGVYQEAEKLAREALVLYGTIHGYYVINAGNAFDALGHALNAQGRHAEAESAYREALRVRQRVLEEGHPDLGWSFQHIGTALRGQRRLAEAEASYRQGLAIRQKAPSSAHTGVADAFEGLCKCLEEEGKYAEEEGTYREWEEWAERSCDGGGAARARIGFVGCLQAQEKYAEAEKTLRECVVIATNSGSPPETTAAFNRLAWRLVTRPESTPRDGPSAVIAAEAAVAATGRTNAEYLDTLAAAYAGARDFSNAVAIQKEAIALLNAAQRQKEFAVRLELYESDRPYRNHWALANRIVDLLAGGKFGEAEPLARDCLAIQELEIPDDWRTFNTKSMLGGALLAQKNYFKAEALLLSGYQGMKERESTIPPANKVCLKAALERLLQLCEATERRDLAAHWKQQLTAFDSTQSGK